MTTAWHPQHRGDFLTTWRDEIFEYPQNGPAKRKAFLGEVAERGYTRVGLSFFPKWLETPALATPFLEEILAAGFGPSLELGPEGDRNKAFRAKYPPAKYAPLLRAFVAYHRTRIADVILGVELDEYWPEEADHTLLGKAARQGAGQKPIAIWCHFTNSWHGRWSWWKQQAWATGLCFFYDTNDQQGGFLVSESEIVEATQVYSERLRTAGGNKKFLAGEYCYKRPEAKGRKLGGLALKHGAVGFMNGGPKPQTEET